MIQPFLLNGTQRAAGGLTADAVTGGHLGLGGQENARPESWYADRVGQADSAQGCR
jgi:hypothetical protein